MVITYKGFSLPFIMLAVPASIFAMSVNDYPYGGFILSFKLLVGCSFLFFLCRVIYKFRGLMFSISTETNEIILSSLWINTFSMRKRRLKQANIKHISLLSQGGIVITTKDEEDIPYPFIANSNDMLWLKEQLTSSFILYAPESSQNVLQID